MTQPMAGHLSGGCGMKIWSVSVDGRGSNHAKLAKTISNLGTDRV